MTSVNEMDRREESVPTSGGPLASSFDNLDIHVQAEQLVRWFQGPTLHYVVALSGGVDSAVVAKAAQLSGQACIAVTASSPSVAQRELRDADHVVASIGIRHTLISTQELTDSNYQRNDHRRCYHCKSHLFSSMSAEFPGSQIVTGTNADDLSDYRPGLEAASQAHVRAPLAELGITKSMVRQLAQLWSIPIAEKPASPCLASRLAYGVEVTAEKLEMIERAERLLNELGLLECRVRLHEGLLARIEVAPESLMQLTVPEVRMRLVAELQQLGFRYVTLDLQGFRSGSLNAVFQISSNARPKPS